MHKKKLFSLLLMVIMAMAANAQQALDFVGKFVTQCEGDTTVKCITVSPKMMEQIVESRQGDDEAHEALNQAIGKLKSMRIVTARAEYFERAQQLLQKHARRFQAEKEYQCDNVRGVFYTRRNRKGKTAELIMLREDIARNQLTIVCLTGDIDKEFLCFLYNNKSFKN